MLWKMSRMEENFSQVNERVKNNPSLHNIHMDFAEVTKSVKRVS